MKNLLVILIVVGILIGVGGCVCGLGGHNKADIIENYCVVKDEVLAGNYQQLSRCLRDNDVVDRAQEMLVPAIEMVIYSELNFMEISVVNPHPTRSGARVYYGLLTLEKISTDESRMNAYGHGWTIAGEVSGWVRTLRNCQSN